MKAKILRLLAATALLFGVAIPLSGTAAQADWDVDDQHQIIPMYIYPDWWNSPNNWTYACQNANDSDIGSTFIANPANGPGGSRNTDYAQIIEVCHDAGQNVIGYVDTSYGAVPLATVKADIDDWYDYYDGDNTGVYDLGDSGSDSHIDGIFIDQMNNFPSSTVTSGDNVTAAVYYREIFEYIKLAGGSTYDDVVGNPGATASTDWQLDDTGLNPTQVADELVVFEGTAAQYDLYTPETWVGDYPASDIAMLVYDVDQGDIDDVCAKLQTDNAGLVEVTQHVITPSPPSTPWNFFQGTSYWTDFRSYCG